jgi:hypothetical protein
MGKEPGALPVMVGGLLTERRHEMGMENTGEERVEPWEGLDRAEAQGVQAYARR